MWLIDRQTDGAAGSRRIQLPAVLKDALIRWYVGVGSRDDEAAGIMLVQQARIGSKWIACNCLGHASLPPILTPAYLSEAETEAPRLFRRQFSLGYAAISRFSRAA